MGNRNKSVFVLGLLAGCAGPSACGSDSFDAKPSELAARLDEDAGVLKGQAKNLLVGEPTTGKGPNCEDRPSGWACSNNVKSSALECKDGVVVSGAFCADTDKACTKTAFDDWTATVSAAGEVTCE